MFVPCKKIIVTEDIKADIQLVKYARDQTKYWVAQDKECTQFVVKNHFQDGVEEIVMQDGILFASYKANRQFDEEKFKSDHPEIFDKCSDKKLNIKLLDALHPQLANEYRFPSNTRSLKIA